MRNIELVSGWKQSAQHCAYFEFSVFPGSVSDLESDVDFLGMSVNSSAAIAGQWVLLVLGVVLLLATILLGYKYRKSKKRDKSLSMLELKQKD